MLSLASASFSYVAPTVVPRSSPVMMNTLMGSDYAKTLPGAGEHLRMHMAHARTTA